MDKTRRGIYFGESTTLSLFLSSLKILREAFCSCVEAVFARIIHAYHE